MKLLVWDFNGTLGYRDDHWRGAIQDLLTAEAPEFATLPAQLPPFLRSSFPWRTPELAHPHLNTAALWWSALEPAFERTFRSLSVDPARAERFARGVRRYYCASHRWHLYPDTLPALDALSAQGWHHVLLTNHVPELPKILRGLGLAGRFDRIVNSATSGYEKPHPEAFAHAAEGLGEVEDIWMIGDSITSDFEGAKRAGWNAVLVRQEPKHSVPCVTNLTDLVTFLATPAATPSNWAVALLHR
jgi:putative hydrolase of the HAD superfamily